MIQTLVPWTCALVLACASVAQSGSDAPDPTELERPGGPGSAWNSAIGLGGGAGGVYGARGGGRIGLRRKGEVGERFSAAIERSLAWLEAHQAEDGRWSAAAESRVGSQQIGDVGVTSLALLAILADGNTMRSGPRRNVVRTAVLWLRDAQNANTGRFVDEDESTRMDHAMATLAIVESYGLSSYKILQSAAQRGINHIESWRAPDGSWEFAAADPLLVAWCEQALCAAKGFKLELNAAALELSDAAHGTPVAADVAPAENAAKLFVDFWRGYQAKDAKALEARFAGLAKVAASMPPAKTARDSMGWYFMTHAGYQVGGPAWTRWFAALETSVLSTQNRGGEHAGTWGDPESETSPDRVYSTAMLCLTMQSTYRYTRMVR